MVFERSSLLRDVPDQWKAVGLASRENQDLPPSYQPLRPPPASDLADGLPRPWKLAAEPGSGRIALLTRLGDLAGFREALDVQLAMLPSKERSRPIVCASELCTGRRSDERRGGQRWVRT